MMAGPSIQSANLLISYTDTHAHTADVWLEVQYVASEHFDTQTGGAAD